MYGKKKNEVAFDLLGLYRKVSALKAESQNAIVKLYTTQNYGVERNFLGLYNCIIEINTA